jgi:hypothetical protein
MKRAGLFLVVAGALLLAASGVLWRQHAPDLEKMKADSATFEDSLKRVHAELVHQSLMLQGLNASMQTVPDSVRRYGAGKAMDATTGYNKAIRKLTMKERDIKLEIASLRRDSDRERADAKRRTLPVAAAGAAALFIGIVLTAIPRRRVGA